MKIKELTPLTYQSLLFCLFFTKSLKKPCTPVDLREMSSMFKDLKKTWGSFRTLTERGYLTKGTHGYVVTYEGYEYAKAIAKVLRYSESNLQ